MKVQTGIWLDSKIAIIVKLERDKVETSDIIAEIDNDVYHVNEGDKGSFMGTTHMNAERKFEQIQNQQITNYFKQILEKLNDTDELFLFGPGQMHTFLAKHISQDKNKFFLLKGTEKSEKMTQNQVVEKVKEFFHHKIPRYVQHNK